MIAATEEGREIVENRRVAAEDFRRLLNRWVVAAGRDHPSLAKVTLLVLDGEDYDAAIGRTA